jgi:hypothetical protein
MHIISNCWRAYSSIPQSEYDHDSVNHFFNFVGLLDPSVNTQRIERM